MNYSEQECEPQTWSQQLAQEIDAYLLHSGTAPSRFGIEAVGDPAFVGRFMKGETSPSLARADKIRAHIQAKTGEQAQQ